MKTVRLIKLLKKRLAVAVILTIMAFIFSFFSPLPPVPKNIKPSPQTTSSPLSSLVKVTRVIDGDTIEIEGGKKIRYIGINTPELHDPRKPIQCYGKEAMEENKRLVEGKTVELQKDISETDKYGRLLRYIFLYDPSASSSPLFVNNYLINEGYAYASTFPPDVKYADIFSNSQKQAMDNRKGLWKDCKFKQ